MNSLEIEHEARSLIARIAPLLADGAECPVCDQAMKLSATDDPTAIAEIEDDVVSVLKKMYDAGVSANREK